MKRRTKKRIIRKSVQIRKNTFLLLTMALTISLGTFALGAQGGKKEKIYYESVRIHSGDTLWSIAAEYKRDGENIEHMIDKIMGCNQMKTENIKSGESIIVPVAAAGGSM